MAKRYIDTGYYKSPFVRGLKGSLKGLYSFIICDCDGAGIWVKDLQIASAYIGFEITEKDFDVFIKSGKAIDLKNGKYFFPDFIEHQYPQGLSDKNPAHNNFIKELIKYNLIDSNLKVLKRDLKGTNEVPMVMVEVMETVNVIVEVTPIEKKLNDFFEFRKKMRKPILDISKESFKNKLITLSNNNIETAIAILDQSIANGWQGIFELKTNLNNNKNEKPVSKYHN